MYSDTGNTTSLVLGFPIRTSSDQRSVDSSPRHIAASHVLHRPLMPRHPPCALKHLQTQKPIVKNRNYTTTTHEQPQPTHPEGKANLDRRELMLATTIHESNTTPHHQNLGQQHASQSSDGEERACCLKAQQCAWQPPHRPVKTGRSRFLSSSMHQTRTHYRRRAIFTNRSAHRTPTVCGRGMSLVVLL